MSSVELNSTALRFVQARSYRELSSQRMPIGAASWKTELSGYVPIFESITTGTLYGRWPDIGLWPLILAHVKETPCPPREIDPSIPLALSDAVLAALAKKPQDRPTAERLASMLAPTPQTNVAKLHSG